MVICNFCSKRESRTRHFSLPFTCKECEHICENYTNDTSVITYVDASGKEINVNKDDEIMLEKTSDSNTFSGKPVDAINDYIKIPC